MSLALALEHAPLTLEDLDMDMQFKLFEDMEYRDIIKSRVNKKTSYIVNSFFIYNPIGKKLKTAAIALPLLLQQLLLQSNNNADLRRCIKSLIPNLFKNIIFYLNKRANLVESSTYVNLVAMIGNIDLQIFPVQNGYEFEVMITKDNKQVIMNFNSSGGLNIKYLKHTDEGRSADGWIYIENCPASIKLVNGFITEEIWLKSVIIEDDQAHDDQEQEEEIHYSSIYHRSNGPALRVWNEYGIFIESWYKNGLLDRDDGPAYHEVFHQYTDDDIVTNIQSKIVDEWHKKGTILKRCETFDRRVLPPIPMKRW